MIYLQVEYLTSSWLRNIIEMTDVGFQRMSNTHNFPMKLIWRQHAPLTLLLVTIFLSLVSTRASATTNVQQAIELETRELLNGKVDPKRFLIYVKMQQSPESIPSDKKTFSATAIDNDFLRRLSKSGRDGGYDTSDLSFTLTVIFDKSIAKDRVALFTTALNERFAIDGKLRSLVVSTAAVYSPKDDEDVASKTTLQKLESEKNQALLEAERARLEVSKQEFETKKSEGLKGLLKDFQILILAVLVALSLIIAIVLGSSSLKTGLSAMASGIKSVGSGLGEALVAQVKAKAQADADARETESASKLGSEQSSGAEAENIDADSVPLDPSWSSGNPEYETYIRRLQEKVIVLAKEKNFGFMQHFQDMLESDDGLPYAAALLVSLDSDTAKALIEDSAPSQMARLKGFLGSKGGLQKANGLRSAAVQEFYGRIAMDEFAASPLMQVKGLGWLTRLDSLGLCNYALELPDDQLAAFLGCFSPARVGLMIKAAPVGDRREKLLKALTSLDAVGKEQILTILQGMSERSESQELAASGLDSIRYITSVIEDLQTEDQAKLFDSIRGKPELETKLRTFYVPFTDLSRLQKDSLLQIFQGRNDKQVAKILFAATDPIRQQVLGIYPEMRRQSIADELKGLDANKAQALANRRASQKMQGEISKYLTKMYREGLIDFNQQEPSQGNQSAA